MIDRDLSSWNYRGRNKGDGARGGVRGLRVLWDLGYGGDNDRSGLSNCEVT